MLRNANIRISDFIMKRKITAIILLTLGIGCVLYPIIGNIINVMRQNSIQDEYNAMVYNLSDETKSQIKNNADEYNKKLANGELNIISTDEDSIDGSYDDGSGYAQSLDVGSEIIALIKIPKIDVELPIYRGTGSDILSKGVGHLRNTSLPVGGSSSHCVLTGHTGLPSAMMFTDISKLQQGDMFYIQYLDEIHAYKVDQIKIVEPNDDSDLKIIPDKDYITLLTCYPYGINSHRLLVRGERTAFNGEVVFDKYGKIENITERNDTEVKTSDVPVKAEEKLNMIDELLGTSAKVNVYGINLNLWFVLIVVLLIIAAIVAWFIHTIVTYRPEQEEEKSK